MFRRLVVSLIIVSGFLFSMVPAALGADQQPFVLHVPVLMYHRIQCDIEPSDNKNRSLFLCPKNFDAQLSYLHDRGWQTVTASQLADALYSGTCLPAKTFVITIDDGALDGYINGAPIMEKYGFRATYAMVVGSVGDYLTNPNLSKPHFSWDQARDLVARGFDIANHTMTHASVASLSKAGLNRQVDAAQAKLTQELGFSPKVFVYPYGSVGKGTAPAYLSSRFEMAFTTKHGGVETTSDPMRSPRIRVSRSTTPAALLRSMMPFSNPCGSTN